MRQKPEVVPYLDLWQQREDARAENRRLREWIDTVGRTCPSDTTCDKALEHGDE